MVFGGAARQAGDSEQLKGLIIVSHHEARPRWDSGESIRGSVCVETVKACNIGGGFACVETIETCKQRAKYRQMRKSNTGRQNSVVPHIMRQWGSLEDKYVEFPDEM